MCDWTVNDQEKSGIGSGRWLDDRLRNPLHFAAEKGNLEAVKLLLQHTQISANAVDLDAKTPAELALEKNFYDVYYLFENPAPKGSWVRSASSPTAVSFSHVIH